MTSSSIASVVPARDVSPSPRGDAGKFITVSAASSSSAADTSSRFTGPMRGASVAVTVDPAIEPSVPPTPMKPNRRFAWSLRKTSAMKHQKIDVPKKASTLVHTKKARPVQMSVADPSPGETNRIST